MTKLNELAKMQGINLKYLSTLSSIPYTTILYLSKNDITKWNDKQIKNISTALNIGQDTFIKNMQQPVLSPFIKWVGGKRQILPELLKYIPSYFNVYHEPFIGGGALLFKLAPKHACINDFNEELINAWNVIKNNLDGLIPYLRQYEKLDTKKHYLDIRSVDRDGRILYMNNIERAARFIYLNKAGYNGLWRVNKRGQNNVPFGGHKKLNLVPDCLYSDADYLSTNEIFITHGDYIKSLDTVKENDFVYLDPPYIPATPTSSFTSYTKNGFGLIQQKQLADKAKELAEKGAKIMLSNADVPLVSELYKDDIFQIHHVKANRVLNSNGKKRGKVGEVIITTY